MRNKSSIIRYNLIVFRQDFRDIDRDNFDAIFAHVSRGVGDDIEVFLMQYLPM